jgi:hypothetical protein
MPQELSRFVGQPCPNGLPLKERAGGVPKQPSELTERSYHAI